MNHLDTDDLLPLTKFLALLPGVKPRVAREELLYFFHDAVMREAESFSFGSCTVLVKDANDFFISNGWGTDHVSPTGAALLTKLYEAGAMPMKQLKPKVVPEAAMHYAASEKTLELKALLRRAEADRERAAHLALIENPSSVSESEFSYRLLDAVFWRHIGKGGGQLMIGGLQVSKSVSTYSSNSGKSHDSTVEFTWTSPARGEQSIGKGSRYEDNRRNDAERNWGLPE